MTQTQPKLHDKDIREPLFDFLEETFGKVRILEEKQIAKVRSDIVMITPTLLYGIEIKSDADTYARLEKQVKYYNWYYDRNIIVVGSSHATHVAEHVPEWWGIVSVEQKADGGQDFYVPGEVLWPQAYEELFERDYSTIGETIENYRRENKAK